MDILQSFDITILYKRIIPICYLCYSTYYFIYKNFNMNMGEKITGIKPIESMLLSKRSLLINISLPFCFLLLDYSFCLITISLIYGSVVKFLISKKYYESSSIYNDGIILGLKKYRFSKFTSATKIDNETLKFKYFDNKPLIITGIEDMNKLLINIPLQLEDENAVNI